MPFHDFMTITIRDQVKLIDQWMCSANYSLFCRRHKTKPSKNIYWTEELDRIRKTVRRLRNHFRFECRSGAADIAYREFDFRSALRRYKDRIVF